MDICEHLSTVAPYASLAEEIRRDIFATLKCREYQTGDVLITESAFVNHVGIIASGQADAFVGHPTASRVAAYTLHAFDYFGDLAAMIGRRSPVTVVCQKATRVYRQRYADFARFMELDPVFKAHFSQIALKKLWHLYQILQGGDAFAAEELPPAAQMPDPIRKAVEFIDTHYDTAISVDQVIRKVGMSRSTFSRHFKRHLGVSFKTYLNQTRLSRAKHLISHEGVNVTEACFAVGFNDTAYFSRIFRKYEGYSPSQHKRSGPWRVAPVLGFNPSVTAAQQGQSL